MNGTHKGWALGLLFCVGAMNLFDRQVINILAQSIKTDLALSDTQLGLLTGTAFGLFYAVMGIPLGRLGDRVDRVKLIGISMLAWSGFTALCGSATSFLHLFFARMGVGVGEAGAQPASTALIADIFPEHRRTGALAIFLASAPVGSFLGLLVGGFIASIWGWRAAFVVAGAPGILLAIVLLATTRDPRATGGRRSPGPSFAATLRILAGRPRFAWLVVGMICSTFLVYVSGAWLPAYFLRAHNMSLGEAGGYIALAVGVGGGLGTLAAGGLCDLMRRRISHVEAKLLMLILAVSLPAMLVTVSSPDRTVALIALFLFNLCAFAWTAPIATLIQNEATSESRALAIAVGVSTANIISLGVGLPLVGLISDHLTPGLGAAGLGYSVAFSVTIAGGIGLIAYARVLLSLRGGGHGQLVN